MGLLVACIGLLSVHVQGAPIKRRDPVKRQLNVADAIEMVRIGDSSYLESPNASENVVQFSPDKSKFAFVTQQGDLTTDTVVYRLLIFNTSEAFNSPTPKVVATLASSSNREAIRQLKWLHDNETIAFLGEQPGHTSQLYEVNVRTTKLERLTDQATPVLYYSMTDSGERFVYVAQSNPRPVMTQEMMQHGFFVTSQQWDDLYTNYPRVATQRVVYVKTPELKTSRRVGRVLDMPPEGVSISPNGRYAFLRAYRSSPPASWNEYRYRADYEADPAMIACSNGEISRCPQQLVIVDLDKLTITPLINAPATNKIAGSNLAVWTVHDSILLVNALLPLDDVDPAERNRRVCHVYAAEVALPEKTLIKIAERREPYPVVSIDRDAKTGQITAHPKLATLGPALTFHKGSEKWTITEVTGAPSEPDDQLVVTLDQDINSPPRLVANDRRTHRKAVVLDLNPQFSQLAFGHVEVFSWKTRRGIAYEGTLYYPTTYLPGTRYPLIIQTHDERRDRFWINGPYTTAYAAQPLANRGFFVLQMGIVDIYDKSSIEGIYKILGTAQEGPYYSDLFESAVDALDHRGFIDRGRVGLTGFSRAAYHVLYALTHSPYHFAAAVIADGINFGYVDCVYYLESNGSSLCEKMNGGGPPYGDSLTGWIKEAPTFRLDKIHAPVLLQAISGPLGEWEIFAGLRWLKRPVDMLNFYPEGEHVLVRPRQRLLSEGSVVDWYCFWLKGEEDADRMKAAQYARWRQMRDAVKARAERANR
jgi:dipeptidyl aminopeptidase/acylaminoacyl peptidase